VETIPPAVRSQIPGWIASLDERLEPASTKVVAVAIDSIYTFASVFGIQPTSETIHAATEIYSDALSELPDWAIEQAICNLKKSWKYQSLPKPVDIRSCLPAEYFRLKNRRLRLETALKDWYNSSPRLG
jgi:hypothetical protein